MDMYKLISCLSTNEKIEMQRELKKHSFQNMRISEYLRNVELDTDTHRSLWKYKENYNDIPIGEINKEKFLKIQGLGLSRWNKWCEFNCL